MSGTSWPGPMPAFIQVVEKMLIDLIYRRVRMPFVLIPLLKKKFYSERSFIYICAD
jgi:hypothetical protein